MGLTRNRDLPLLQQVLLVVLMALLSAALWYGWFAWDTEYHYDADAGGTTGPYQLWQGVGAFFCGLVVLAIAYRTLHFAVALLVLPASFTLAWISTASAMDTSGLWAVGAILVAVGTTLGTAVLLGIAAGIEALGRRRSRASSGSVRM